MKLFKKLQKLILFSVPFFFIASPALAAAPDGFGPWADSVASSSQGLMKNGSPVPAIRSDISSALGIAENDTVEGNFFSLGFGGIISLGFDNGISSGVIIVEATNPGYPGEVAKVEVSENGTSWVMAGTVTQDGTVDKPEGLGCARFVRITDISDPNIFSDGTADGYDVDGVQASGVACSPTPSPTPPTPTTTTTTTTTTSNTSCTTTVNTIPSIIEAHRVSPTSISVSWGPFAGLNNFIVQYGFSDGNWQFSTNVSGFTTTINGLPANRPIWIHVAAVDGCATGSYGSSVLVGGAAATNTPGFPNTGSGCINSGNPLIPCLPNTGFGPKDKNIPWKVALPTGVLMLASTSFVILKKRKI